MPSWLHTPTYVNLKQNIEVTGFTIPKGAQVLVNAWALCRDLSIWDEPNLFMLERFLGIEIDLRG